MSAKSKSSVVFFKAISENADDDAYYNVFRSANFHVTLIPILDFEFVNLEELFIRLKKPNDYEGIIFSSPRCVTGIQLSVGRENPISVLNDWKNHKHFAVGEKTAQMLQDLGIDAQGKEAGNAKNLAEIILKGQYEKPFLYPKGSLTKDTFKSLLKENHISTDDITIYETKPHPEIESYIKNIKFFCFSKPVYFVFFSPSGVKFTLPLLKKYEIDLNQIQFLAIGPTTEGALIENGLEVKATSSKPDPNSLLNTILECSRSEVQ